MWHVIAHHRTWASYQPDGFYVVPPSKLPKLKAWTLHCVMAREDEDMANEPLHINGVESSSLVSIGTCILYPSINLTTEPVSNVT